MIVRNGRTVPWVTRWSGEVRDDALQRTRDAQGRYSLTYEDETPEDRVDGVLWMRSGNDRGAGEPQWAQVHSERQSICMLDPRCQVCGEQIEGVIPWLLPRSAADGKSAAGLITTMTPPTCAACLPIAMTQCPHLSTHRVDLYEVRSHRPWAYFADYIDASGQHRQGAADGRTPAADRRRDLRAR